MDEQEFNRIKNMSQEEAEAYLNELNACDHDCSSCTANCEENTNLTPRLAKRIIGVYGGKGGVGVSAVTVQLASAFAKLGLKTCIIDADISGCSIPHMLGVTESASNDGEKVNPVKAANGVSFVSMASILSQTDEPIYYPGTDLARMAGFFYIGSNWDADMDIMLIDLPSGDNDVVLDFFTTIPFDGAVIVTTPGKLAVDPTKRAINLASMLMIPVYGLVENFSVDPGQEHITELYGDMPLLAALPRSEAIADAADEGRLAECGTALFETLASAIAEDLKK